MSRYSETDTYSQAGDWLMGTARRNPEALLLLAAGCCLLMRSGGNLSSRAASHSRPGEHSEGYQSEPRRAPSDIGRDSSNVRDGLSRAANTATEYASEIKDRVSDAARSYTEAVSDFAQDAGRNVSEQSARLTRQAQSTLQSSMNRVMREQPLAVVMAGLAAGAAVAAVFPSTEIEDRTLGSAGEGLRQAAGKAAEKVKDAAGKAGDRLKSAAEERGLTSEGLKEVAGEVADTFTSAVSGKPDDPSRATTTVPQSGAAATGPGQSFGAGQSGRAANRSSDAGRSDMSPRQGNR